MANIDEAVSSYVNAIKTMDIVFHCFCISNFLILFPPVERPRDGYRSGVHTRRHGRMRFPRLELPHRHRRHRPNGKRCLCPCVCSCRSRIATSMPLQHTPMRSMSQPPLRGNKLVTTK